MSDTPHIIGELRPASVLGLPPRVAAVLLDRMGPDEEVLWNGPARGMSARAKRIVRTGALVVGAVLVVTQALSVREQGAAYLTMTLPAVVFSIAVVAGFGWLMVRARKRVHYIVTDRRAVVFTPIIGASYRYAKGRDGRYRWVRDWSGEYDPLRSMPIAPDSVVEVDGDDIVWTRLDPGRGSADEHGIGADMLAMVADFQVNAFARWRVAGDIHAAARRINRELARRAD